MNIYVTKQQAHIIKDLCPNLSSINLFRPDIEIIIDKVEEQFHRVSIDDVSMSVYRALFSNLVRPIDGEDGKSYIEVGHDNRIFNLVVEEV